MFKIIKKEPLNPSMTRMVIEAPFVARKAMPDSLSSSGSTKPGNGFP